jgi:flagellar L-ring protein precursor FlgH
MTFSIRGDIGRCLAIAALTGLASCGAVDRLADIGKPPSLSAIESPVEKPGYRPVRLPMPEPVSYVHQPNSLWRSGARGFFKDQRASRVGDILTVTVSIDDKAELENSTKRKRANSENLGINQLAGVASEVSKILSKGAIPSDLIDVGSDASSEGSGSVDRTEALETTVAAIVTQVLPNGNLVIEGKQEVRVNFEVRELIVAGIVRPEDISNNNMITSEKIAEARISYGGRGQITDVQQPRYGQQFLDIVLPF